MSVLDELTGLEQKVRSRMKELRPLLDEYSELQRAAERLGIVTDDAPAPKQRRAGGSPRHAAKPRQAAAIASATTAADAVVPAAAVPDAAAAPTVRRASRKTQTKAKAAKSKMSTRTSRQPGGSRSGQRAEQLAALVQARPGLTVKDAGAEFGVDPTSLYRLVKQLESAGKLKKVGREMHPA